MGTGRAISCHSQVPCLLRGVCHPHALPGWRCGRRRGIGVSPAPAGPFLDTREEAEGGGGRGLQRAEGVSAWDPEGHVTT